MPGTIRLAALLAVVAAVAALSGCGSDEISGEIPQTNADELNIALAGVRAEIEAGCTDPDQAREQAQAFVNEVNELPADPSGELKPELQNAAAHLRTLVESECASTEPPTTTEPPPTSSTTSSTTEETEPTTTDETTTTTTTTEETTPDEDGGGPPGNGPPGGDGPPGQDGGTGGTGSGDEGDE